MSAPCPSVTTEKCRHCRKRAASRPRKLCRACHTDREIRQQYPPASRWGNRQYDGPISGRRPWSPTAARPGTKAKIRVMIRRYQRREGLFHPLDAVLDPPEVR